MSSEDQFAPVLIGQARLPIKDNSGLLQLLREWMTDESGYDEETLPLLRKMLDEGRPPGQKLFGE